ncbi:MAG: MBL fold metallo-hydrolase [candidate division WOR-3 bacterium]|uniref:MBL fold metallo-hydrolase n=1 Tax=candidate division WOR-3 bacterium TaxID=2052148 RepID=A0A7C4VZ18_UNCW3
MDRIIFLGSGGARIVVFKQIRASGGIWLTLNNKNLLIDPGPGSLVRIVSSKHKLDPTSIDAVLLSHKHLDHSGDINNIIEAITIGGTQKRGILFAPYDALEGDDPVVYRYLRSYLEKIVILKEKEVYNLNGVTFTCPIRHEHRGETYGFLFKTDKIKIGYIADTKFFDGLISAYKESEILIMNVVREKPSELDHLSLEDVKTLIKEIRPKICFLTHFGMTMIKKKPWLIAEELNKEFSNINVKVIAANDGMKYDL